MSDFCWGVVLRVGEDIVDMLGMWSMEIEKAMFAGVGFGCVVKVYRDESCLCGQSVFVVCLLVRGK